LLKTRKPPGVEKPLSTRLSQHHGGFQMPVQIATECVLFPELLTAP
jgi:hypothetical protein